MGGLDVASAVAGSIGQTAWEMDEARKRQHDAQDTAAWNFAHRYQTTVADLKAAGLNPMLAYMQGGGNAPGGSSASSTRGDAVGAMNQSKIASAQEANIKADTLNKVSQSENIAADTKVKLQSAEYTSYLINEVSEKIQNLQKEYDVLEMQRLKYSSDWNLTQQLAAKEAEMTHYYRMLTALTGNEVAISDPKAEAARTTGAFAAHGRNISEGLSPLSDFVGKRPWSTRSEDIETETLTRHKGGYTRTRQKQGGYSPN